MHDLKIRGITLKATEQPIDTSTAAGEAFLDMLGVFAEFETTYAVSVNWKVSQKPKPKENTKAECRKTRLMLRL